MDRIQVTLHVFFEEPFYVGVLERVEDGRLTVCRTVFGAEPKDAEVYAWLLKEYDRLTPSPAVEADARVRCMSPKRAKRDAGRHLAAQGIGTRSQQALARAREQSKAEHKTLRCERREEQAQRRFELRQQKRKEKHRGR